MRILFLAAISLALAGCNSARLDASAQEDAQRCAAIGYPRGSAQHLECLKLQSSNRIAAASLDQGLRAPDAR
jgi:hypothetical protein